MTADSSLCPDAAILFSVVQKTINVQKTVSLTLFLQPPGKTTSFIVHKIGFFLVSWKRTKTRATRVVVGNPEELSLDITEVWFLQLGVSKNIKNGLLSLLKKGKSDFGAVLYQICDTVFLGVAGSWWADCRIDQLPSVTFLCSCLYVTQWVTHLWQMGFSALWFRFDWPRPTPCSLTDSFMNPHRGVFLWLRGDGVWCLLSHTYQEMILWLCSKAYKISF